MRAALPSGKVGDWKNCFTVADNSQFWRSGQSTKTYHSNINYNKSWLQTLFTFQIWKIVLTVCF